MRMSLEEERRALLEQIEARRGLYRRMLSGDIENRKTTGTHRKTIGHTISPQHNRLGQWLLDHPVQVATGVALLVWLGPRLIRRNQARSKTVRQAPPAGQYPGVLKAIAGMMVLLLRDPRQLQTTASMVSNFWRWLRRNTSNKNQTHGKQPYA